MHNNILIFTGCAMKRPKEKPVRSKAATVTAAILLLEARKQNRNLLIRDLWKNGTDSVHDMRVMNIDAKYHSAKTPEKCLQEVEWTTKKMYLEACLQQRWQLYPFVISVKRLLVIEGTATPEKIASHLAIKWRKPYYRTSVYVKNRVGITLVRFTHQCIRESKGASAQY